MPTIQHSRGSYSIVVDTEVKQRRRAEYPTIDGVSVIQELGFLETKTYRFYWVTTAQLQSELETLEDEAASGWIIVGEVGRTPIHEALDLYNAQITMHRYIAT